MLQAAKEAAELAEVVNELLDYLKFLAMDEVIAREEAGNIDLDLLSPDEYVKHKPDTLEEAIERACRHKIEEAKKLFHTDYEGREAKMLTKLVELEVKSGVTPPKPPQLPAGGPTAAAAPPPAPPAGKKKWTGDVWPMKEARWICSCYPVALLSYCLGGGHFQR